MKKTLFLSAILGAALCSSAFGNPLTTDTSVVGGITYNGGVYTIASPTNNFSSVGKSADVTSTSGDIEAGSSIGWHAFASNQNDLTYGHTIHLTKAGTYKTDFSPFSFGGLIVDSSIDGNVTLGRNTTGVEINGTNAVNMSIGANTTILGGPDNKIEHEGVHVMKGGTWDIAEAKTLTLDASTKSVTFHDDAQVVLSGKGTLALNGSGLTFGSGASITVGANNTLALTTGEGWAMVGEETAARTSGNGFGYATRTRDFGSSIVNNGTITVNGGEATFDNGVVTGTGDSTTYYVNEAATATTATLSGATALIVNGTGSGAFAMQGNTYGNLDITINGGKVTTTRSDGTGFTKGNVTINAGGTLAVVGGGQDALGWGDNKTKVITLLGSEGQAATLDLSYTNASSASVTMATLLDMQGHSKVLGTGAFNTFGTGISVTGTDNVISTRVEVRKGVTVNVGDASTLLISGNVSASSQSGQGENYTLTKAGNGVLTISGNISGYNASRAVIINGDGANTVISSGTITGATLNNVKLAKGSAQTITGTVTLNNATLTNRLNVNDGGSLTLQNGATATQTSGFSMVVDGNATLTFEAGSYDLSKPSDGLAIYTGSAMTVKNGANLTVNKICYSYNQPEKNGNVTVEEGGVLTITSGNSYVNSLTSAGTATVGGNIHAQDFLKANNSYTQTAGTATIEKYLGLAANAGVVLSDTGKMVVKGTSTDTGNGIWMGAESTITMGANSTLEVKPVGLTFKNGTITNTSTTDERQIGTNDYQDAYRGDITISADTTVNSGQTVVSGYTFSGGSVKVNTGATTNILATLSANDTKTDLLVTGSNKEEKIFTEAKFGDKDVTLGTLTMDADTTVTVGDHNHTLALESLTVNGSGSVINANLEISGGTMTMSSSVEMGCSVTLSNEKLVLTNGVVEDGVLQMYTLFTGVESLTLGSGDPVEMGWYDASTVLSSLTINGGEPITDAGLGNYVIGYWNGTVTISDKSVPEPATATLSLLALAALAARRKRK